MCVYIILILWQFHKCFGHGHLPLLTLPRSAFLAHSTWYSPLFNTRLIYAAQMVLTIGLPLHPAHNLFSEHNPQLTHEILSISPSQGIHASLFRPSLLSSLSGAVNCRLAIIVPFIES